MIQKIMSQVANIFKEHYIQDYVFSGKIFCLGNGMSYKLSAIEPCQFYLALQVNILNRATAV
ncbi:hypothetical protein C7271_05850 [filamentous cyanobacterium CCP5]|nr:hypothetical protein C7271_05850 [filamentous cyanobacterium CCP5]